MAALLWEGKKGRGGGSVVGPDSNSKRGPALHFPGIGMKRHPRMDGTVLYCKLCMSVRLNIRFQPFWWFSYLQEK